MEKVRSGAWTLMTASAQPTVASFDVRVSNHGGAEEIISGFSFGYYRIVPAILSDPKQPSVWEKAFFVWTNYYKE